MTQLLQFSLFSNTITIFQIREKLLETSKNNLDIFNALDVVISKYGGFGKYSGIATDGAEIIFGNKIG